MNGSETKPVAEEAPLMVDNLDQFVQVLLGWHQKQVATLEHFMTIPQGSAVQVGEDEELILIDDAHRGFIAGLSLALMHLGILPFKAEVEEETDDVCPPVN